MGLRDWTNSTRSTRRLQGWVPFPTRTCLHRQITQPTQTAGNTNSDQAGETDYFELPPASEWRNTFVSNTAAVRDRISVRSQATATLLANAFIPAGSSSKVIIEAYPGPGALTRAIMQLPKSRVRKIIVLEDHEPYLQYLKSLQNVDPRVHVLSLNGFNWESYHILEADGLLNDVENVPWDAGVHPHLHFVSHLPKTTLGEQLVSQLFRSVPERSWLFKYGRIPMSFIMHDWVRERICASTTDKSRCKLSVIAQATSDCAEAVSSSRLLPYESHFHPTILRTSTKRENRRGGMVAYNILPLEYQIIERGMLDKWDYCLRRLFVLKSTALKSAVRNLAPAAQSLLEKIGNPDLPGSDYVDVDTPIRKMSVEDWAILVRAFDRWTFAPEDLIIIDSHSGEKHS